MAAERAREGGQRNGRVKFCAGPVISEGNKLLNRNLLLKLKKVGMVQVEGRLAKLDTFEFALRYLRAHEEDLLSTRRMQGRQDVVAIIECPKMWEMFRRVAHECISFDSTSSRFACLRS